MDGHKPLANYQFQRCIQDNEWFLPCYMLHIFKLLNYWFLSCYSHIMFHSFVDAKTLHSTAGKELSWDAFFHLLHLACSWAWFCWHCRCRWWCLLQSGDERHLVHERQQSLERGRKKDPFLLQLFIESTTQVGNIVLDCTTSIST